MAQRSYLMVETPQGHLAVLEAANKLPLLWLALLDAALPEAEFSDGPTLRLTDGASIGIVIERATALRRVAARRAGVAAWVGEAGGTVLDEFVGFLGEQPGSMFRLDLSEWVELFESREQALQSLRSGIAALDAKVTKRRPPSVKNLLDEIGLLGRAAQEPAFGVLLAGIACSGREPWRRDPPRERRSAEDYITWSRKADRHFVSADGRVVATTVTNSNNVETPVIWAPASSEIVTYASVLPDEVGYLFPQVLSGDGRSLFCMSTWHPGTVAKALRFGPDGPRTLHEGVPSFGALACSTTGDVAGGALYSSDSAPACAAVWRDGIGVQQLADVAPDSVVKCVSGDGQVFGVELGLQDVTGAYSGSQAQIWCEDPARRCVVLSGWSLRWFALSADGRRGVIRVQAEKSGEWRWHFWREGAGTVQIEYGLPADVFPAFSPDLGCALACTEDALRLWRPDHEPETLMSTDGMVVEPRHVSSAGDWGVATVRNPANFATAAVLLWERGRGVRHFDAPTSDTRLGLGLWVASACESLDELVLFGQWRDSGEPATWSLQRGFVGWGAAPRPIPEPPVDFTPIARAIDFVYVEMPARQRPMRELVQDFRAMYPGLRPMLYFTASWCEPCNALEALLRQPVLQGLMHGHLLMRVDIDRIGTGSRSIGFQASAVPTFVVLDDEGCATERIIDGDAWEKTTEANVVSALTPWLRDGTSSARD